MDRMSFSELQKAMPWTSLWSEDFTKDPRPYAKFLHCLCNISAKLGSIMQGVEMSDHYGADYALGMDRHDDGTALAFIVMSALKAANVYPGGPLDLWAFIESDLKRRSK